MKFIELIDEFKSTGQGLMSVGQYKGVGYILDILSPCNLLVFGLGDDANLWAQINDGGRTIFLEDDKEWIDRLSGQSLEIHSVEYSTRAQDHVEIDFDTEKLKMKLPDSIVDTKWDLIFVDGPLGHNPDHILGHAPPRPYKGPGRMQSIYTAHCLLKKGGICIVDDVQRGIERKYASHFFGMENLYTLIETKVGIFKKRE